MDDAARNPPEICRRGGAYPIRRRDRVKAWMPRRPHRIFSTAAVDATNIRAAPVTRLASIPQDVAARMRVFLGARRRLHA
jgi:hypothetical protein